MILVFGMKGQLAQELQASDQVIAIDRSKADLANPQDCAKIIQSLKPSAVINAAAYTAVDRAEKEEELATLINASAPASMAKACCKIDIPFLQISTDFVFSGSGKSGWSTTDLTAPKNAYGRSKLKSEKSVIASGANYAILRTSWVFSAFGNNFLKTMLAKAKTQDVLKVVNDQIGGPTPAKDLAKACIKVVNELTKNPNKKGIYHFSGRPDVSWCDFANTIFEIAGLSAVAHPIPSSEYQTPAKRPLNSRLDCRLTESTFKISRPNWRDGLEEILQNLENINETT